MDTLSPNFNPDDYLHDNQAKPELDGAGTPVRTRKIADYCGARDDSLALYKKAERAYRLFAARMEAANKAARFAAPNQRGGWFSDLDFAKLQQETEGNGDRWEAYRRRVDKAVWSELIENTGYASLLDAQAKKEFRATLEDCPPPVTEDNCAATLGALYRDAGKMQARGLVNIFCTLNFEDYKSNDCFSIGKRIVMEYAVEKRYRGWSWIYSSYGGYPKRDSLVDLEKAIDLMDGKQVKDPHQAIDRHVEASGLDTQQFENDVFKLRWYKKGTMHVYIKSAKHRAQLNQIIAEHFGANLADASERPNGHDPFFKGKVKVRNTGVSKVDRNAYYTPPNLSDVVAFEAGIHEFKDQVSVLEPSCGHGSLMNAAYKAGAYIIHGVENHLASADAAQDRLNKLFKDGGRVTEQYGTSFAKVFKADFDMWEPDHTGRDGYTHILMNPPFDHQLRHVVKAYSYLRKVERNYKGEEITDRGCLVAIMGANVMTNNSHDFCEFRAWLHAKGAIVKKLPSGSFRASGTDVETIMIRIPAETEYR